jgi:hypothetical protein
MTVVAVSYRVEAEEAGIAAVRAKDRLVKDWNPETWHLESVYEGIDGVWSVGFHAEIGHWSG